MASDQIDIPNVLPVLPLRDTVVFPLTVASLLVGKERSLRLVEDSQRTHRLIGLVTQRNPDSPADVDDLYRVGTVALLQNIVRAPDGTLRIIVQGIERIRIYEYLKTEPYLMARVQPEPEAPAQGLEAEALQRTARELFRQIMGLTSPDLMAAADSIADPRQLAYIMASSYPFSTSDRQSILEQNSIVDMLRRLIELLQHELAVGELKDRVTSETRETISKGQREYILREQLKTIRKELGEGDSEEEALDELGQQLAEVDLPEDARKEVDRELQRLKRIPAASPEYGIIRTFLEWMRDLPWSRVSGGSIDIPRARQTLDQDHHDLERIKDRILEYLSVKKLREERGVASKPSAEQSRAEPILCFVGPPGVGKTSLGQSIARALDRKFARMSLGGIHDEAEIRGHRRTYIGAMPGRIIQALRRVETRDPIFMLDEVDKLGVGFHGDPSAALLEVLDPAQNNNFVDTYLGVPFDLSGVLFICTANAVDTIPPPLLDRMEVLRLPGYTDAEKVQIARRFLLPKLLVAHALREDEFSIDDDALRRILRSYTREAGVRNLERILAEVIRKVTRQMTEGKQPPARITAETLAQFIGPPRFFDEVVERIDRPGVATGLAWTPVGGEVLFVEATMMPSQKERLILTGMLGEVMRESAQAALSFLRSSSWRLGIDPKVFDHKAVHIHVPAGATPKDGPSAGITIAVALASLLSDRIVDSDVAMTGEVTLRGKVLPVGGIKEKVLAAHRAGVRRVILPHRNQGSLDDIHEEVRKSLQFIWIDSVDEAIADAMPSLLPAPEMHAPH